MKVKYNPKSLENILPTNGSKWVNKETTSIRIPTVLKDDVMDYALYIDKDGIRYDKLLEVYQYIKSIENKLDVVKSYKSNGASSLIRELKELISNLH